MKNSKIFLVIIIITVIGIAPVMITKVFSKNSKAEKNASNSEQIEIIENNKVVENEETANKVVINEKGNVISSEQVKIENKVEEPIIEENVVETPVEEVKNETSNNTNAEGNNKSYFDDALFIGDSRTVGIMEYADMNNATFFCNTGMSVYNIKDKKVSVNKVGKMTLDQLLSNKKFGKIYVMLGINELGYDFNKTCSKYKDLINYIDSKQDNPIIYIEANLHVTQAKSNQDKVINNKNIDRFNNEISKLADNKRIFYIDINKKFDDATGNLAAKYTQDKVHIFAKYYKEWGEWFSQNTF